MADFGDYEDDLNVGAGAVAGVFGYGDEYQGDLDPLADQQQDILEDDVDLGELEAQPEGEPEPPAAATQATAAPSPQDVKARLAALAQKKRAEAEGGGSGKKKSKGDKDKEGKKSKKGKEGKEGKNKRPQRPQRNAGGGEERTERRQRTPGEDGPQGSVDSKELQQNDADKDFIDDEADNFAPGEDEMDDEEARLAAAPEAEEADDAEEMAFGRKKKKQKGDDHQQMALEVDDKIAKMEAAAELDFEQKNQGKAGTNKLKMLKEVQEFLAVRKYHELFLVHGGLGVLKAWLEPYPSGELPNVSVRRTILNACKNLPIDTTRDDHRDSLKKSQLGSRIMFLAHCPEETQENKKAAVELVQKWSRPIFFDPEAEAEKKRAKEEALRKARQQALEQAKLREKEEAVQEAARKIRYGQAGYRWHAAIPQTMKLDYVVAPDSQLANNPESAVSQAAAGMQSRAAGGGKKDEDVFQKKMREVQRKQKGGTARAAVPSVEGRNIVF